MNAEFAQQLSQLKIIPVVTIQDASQAEPLAAALSAAGLPIAEITLRTPCAIDAIQTLAGQGGFLVGAGTVLNVRQAESAIEAGAKFIVSPGLDESVVSRCREKEIPVIPGVSTATEVQRAFNMGLRVVKFFPAEAAGGIDMLKALSAPFHQLQFVPTGGIHAGNFSNYLNLPCTLAVGGSWVVSNKMLQDNDFAAIESVTREALTS